MRSATATEALMRLALMSLLAFSSCTCTPPQVVTPPSSSTPQPLPPQPKTQTPVIERAQRSSTELPAETSPKPLLKLRALLAEVLLSAGAGRVAEAQRTAASAELDTLLDQLQDVPAAARARLALLEALSAIAELDKQNKTSSPKESDDVGKPKSNQ